MTGAYGALTPSALDKAVIAITSRLPNNWLGLRLAIGLRRIVTMRLSRDGGLDVERWGLLMRLHPRDNGCEKNLLFTPQMYEVPECAELVSEISRTKSSGRKFVFVDIGANVGLFSLFVASHARGNTKILAIEPAPENLRRLRFNVTANPNVPIQVIPSALGESAGRVVIEVNSRDRGGTRTRALKKRDPADIVSAECYPLLEVLKKEAVTYIDALKIDVEGAEDEILVPFFSSAPPTLWPGLLIIEDARGVWRTDLFSLLAERGYRTSAQSKLNVMMRR